MTIETSIRSVARRYHRRNAAFMEATIDLHEAVLVGRAAGLTLRKLADLTGLSFARIHQIEKEAKRG